jgi:pimeloyl-ACP methyl ester carboxylesterase
VKIRAVQLGSVELSIAEAGEGGRPLLLLHGFGGAKEDFTDWLDSLATLGWHVVAPDHRGHGASEQPADEAAYSFELLTADGLELADELGWDRFALLGHSMGGMIAQLVALRAGDRLDGLVLMDTHHRGVKMDRGLVDLAVAVARTEGMEALANAMDALNEESEPLGTEADARLKAERPGYAEFGRRKLLNSSPEMWAKLAIEVIDHPDTLDDLGSLDVPTLVVVGEQDKPFRKASKRMADAIPGAQLVVLPEAGHSPQFETPERWWDAVSGFLATLPTQEPAPAP